MQVPLLKKITINCAVKDAIATDKFKSSSLYGNGDAGVKIAEILAKVELTYSKTITY